MRAAGGLPYWSSGCLCGGSDQVANFACAIAAIIKRMHGSSVTTVKLLEAIVPRMVQTIQNASMITKLLPWGLGIVAIVALGWLFSSTVAVPIRSPMYPREVYAVIEIRAIHAVQAQYLSEFRQYGKNLRELGPPAEGELPGAQAADLIPADLATGTNNGYRFDLAGDGSRYVITATPVALNVTGCRSFFSDQTLVIHEHHGCEQATAQDPELR